MGVVLAAVFKTAPGGQEDLTGLGGITSAMELHEDPLE